MFLYKKHEVPESYDDLKALPFERALSIMRRMYIEGILLHVLLIGVVVAVCFYMWSALTKGPDGFFGFILSLLLVVNVFNLSFTVRRGIRLTTGFIYFRKDLKKSAGQ